MTTIKLAILNGYASIYLFIWGLIKFNTVEGTIHLSCAFILLIFGTIALKSDKEKS